MNRLRGHYSVKQTLYGVPGESMQGGRRSVVACPDCLKKGKRVSLFTNYTGKAIRDYWCATCGHTSKRSIEKLKNKGLEYGE